MLLLVVVPSDLVRMGVFVGRRHGLRSFSLALQTLIEWTTSSSADLPPGFRVVR